MTDPKDVVAVIKNLDNDEFTTINLRPPAMPAGLWWIAEADWRIAADVLRFNAPPHRLRTSRSFIVRDAHGWAVSAFYNT